MTASRSPVHGVAVIDRLAAYTGLLGWMRRRCADGITILMYHKVLPERVVPAYPLRNLVVDTPSFNRQMAWLAEHFEVLTVRDAMASLDRGIEKRARGSRPLACVTFDDGYRDNFDHAAPILESHGLRATFFVTTGFVDGAPLWFDRAALAWCRDSSAALQQASDAAPECREAITGAATLDAWMGVLKRLSPESRKTVVDVIDASAIKPDEVFGAMMPDQIRELADRGHEIGSHSVTHPILTSLDDAPLRLELEQSRSVVCDWTGRQADGFCYPNGDHDERVIMAARAAGYSYGIGVRRGVARYESNRMALPRRGIHSSDRHKMTIEFFESEVVGWHDLLRSSRKRLSSIQAYRR